MANNYTLFSEVLVIEGGDEEKKKQRQWIIHQLMTTVGYWKAKELGEQVFFPEDDIPEAYDGLDASYIGPLFLTDWPDLDDTEPCAGFQMDDCADGVILYAEENGEPAQVAWLVQKFLKEFAPEADWSMEWAHTCSKARPGEFGGGAVLVTAQTAYYFNTYTAICDKRQSLAEEKDDDGTTEAPTDQPGMDGVGDGGKDELEAPTDPGDV